MSTMPCVMLHFAELTQHERIGTFKSNGRPVSGIFASISESNLVRPLVRLATLRPIGCKLSLSADCFAGFTHRQQENFERRHQSRTEASVIAGCLNLHDRLNQI